MDELYEVNKKECIFYISHIFRESNTRFYTFLKKKIASIDLE